MDNSKSSELTRETVLRVIMDNNQGAEIVRETLMKVLTGDEVRGAVIHALCNLGLIRKRANAPKRGNKDSWYTNPTTDYELTAKGLRRLQGD